MSAVDTHPPMGGEDYSEHAAGGGGGARMFSRWMAPLEAVSAVLMLAIITLLLTTVVTRYVLATPIVWVDEVVSICFIWVTMIGSALAMHRNEHLRLTLVVDRLPERWRHLVHGFALAAVAAFLVALLPFAWEYTQEEWFIRTPALDLPNSFRVAAIPFGLDRKSVV